MHPKNKLRLKIFLAFAEIAARTLSVLSILWFTGYVFLRVIAYILFYPADPADIEPDISISCRTERQPILQYASLDGAAGANAVLADFGVNWRLTPADAVCLSKEKGRFPAESAA